MEPYTLRIPQSNMAGNISQVSSMIDFPASHVTDYQMGNPIKSYFHLVIYYHL